LCGSESICVTEHVEVPDDGTHWREHRKSHPVLHTLIFASLPLAIHLVLCHPQVDCARIKLNDNTSGVEECWWKKVSPTSGHRSILCWVVRIEKEIGFFVFVFPNVKYRSYYSVCVCVYVCVCSYRN
jgi:hypothetical protein